MADISATFNYPVIVSRTLDPNGKSLRTVVALHDHEISDADINLIQDLQDSKRIAVLNDMVSSGSLTYAPMSFNTNNPNTFVIPGFDVLFNGTVITITGNQSADITQNRVNLPPPSFWATGTAEEDARIYVVFLEIWYQSLNPVTGLGYYQDPITKLFYFYPYGCTQPDPSNAEILPDDSTDPLQGLFTTERAQIQWRINVQRVGLNYNFSQYKFGLDPDTTDVPSFSTVMNAVYAQAGLATQTAGQSPLAGLLPYQYTYMGGNPNISSWSSTANYVDGSIVLYNGSYYVAYLPNTNQQPPNSAYWNPFPINGDTGLWVAGDGNVNNSLGTMDGYSYAMPLAVVFQRNTGNFDITNNLFGCGNSSFPAIVNGGTNGTLSSGVSGRFDNKLADQIFADDCVDTRSIVQLQGTPLDESMRFGFGDLVTGNTKLAISRGSSAGSKAEALGSTLSYNVSIAPATAAVNVDLLGQWDGFANGFSSDQRTFSTTFQITTAQKTTGTLNSPWVVGDSFTISLPTTSNATITSVDVTALVSNSIAGTLTPAALLQGQFSLTGLNSKSVTTQFIVNLTGTAFDPGSNNLYVTVGVTYPAGSNMNLQVVPFSVDGGLLNDQTAGAIFPVYGVSEYDVLAQQIALPPGNTAVSAIASVNGVYTYNPEYSNIILGTKIQLAVSGSQGIQTTVGGSTVTTFTLPMQNIEGTVDGLYCTHCFDSVTGTQYQISSRTMGTVSASSTQTVIVVQGAVPTSSTVIFSILAQNTSQLAYNAPVKGVTQIEETILFGNFTTDSNYPVDSRIVVENVSTAVVNSVTTSTIVLGANGCTLKGISGDNVNFLCWTATQTISQPYATLTAVPIQNANFINGTVVLTIQNVTLTGTNAQPFLICGSILPAFTPQSSLVISEQYVPYQGEGVLNRNYEILHSEDTGLLTTNGTGAAPVIGLSDVYPYNRELPIITTLPAQPNWSDSGLTNTPIATLFDNNYVAMRANNVEDTFDVPLHTNDFIPPINKDTRKTVAFSATATGGRGFSQAIPHLGYAITAPTSRTVLGQNLQTTIAPITLYVDNSVGNDSNSGLTLQTAKQTLGAALSELPPVLTYPCVILINDTGVPFTISQLTTSLETVALGDGDIRSSKIYCLGNLSRVIQEEGRLVISQIDGATQPVVIDATGWGGFGDGPTSAFYIDTSRVILNGIQFKGFQNPAITAYNADIDMVNCSWVNNVQAGSYVGCDSVIFDGGSLSVPDGGVGQISVQSNVVVSNVTLICGGPSYTPGAFFNGSRSSTLTFQLHNTLLTSEYEAATPSNLSFPASAVVAEASLNSSISVASSFQTNGSAILQANSVLSQTAIVTPFLGGVTADSSSSVVTQVG